LREDLKVLRVSGSAALSEYLGDLVVYRSLVPCDSRLPDLDALRSRFGLEGDRIPRKTELDYARVVSEMLQSARQHEGCGSQLSGLVMVGDTEHNDGTAFANLCRVLSLPGAVFIGDENGDEPRLEANPSDGGRVLYRANRWSLLEDFDRLLAEGEPAIGPGTVVVVDIDKTALGARGRNHRPIDAARTAAARLTVAELVGERADPELVQAAYDRLNRPAFHAFTTDNQDYLAYLCLLVGAGWVGLDDLIGGIENGEWSDFASLLAGVSETLDALPSGLRDVHQRVAGAVVAGDPTPFKEFRRAEFVQTLARMAADDDGAPVESVLAERITLTAEVRQWALEWRARGALIFGLSDKPDEASMPTPEMAERGLLPLHRTPALVVGEG
jgi:hypothetical protein